MPTISSSVGRNGQNIKEDVLIVQQLLVNAGFMPELTRNGKSNIDGVCGSGTIGCICNFQAQVVKYDDPDGRIDPGGPTWDHLIESAEAAQDPAPDQNVRFLAKLQEKYPRGFTAAVYVLYDFQDNNNQEFGRAAAIYARDFCSVGIDSNETLRFGIARPVRSIDELAKFLGKLNDVLKQAYIGNGGSQEDALPDYLKVKTLGILSHGQPHGIRIDPTLNGNCDLVVGSTELTAFVDAIRGYLTPDVSISLFSCNTGRDANGTEPTEIWYLDAADNHSGASGFASSLSQLLGADASVYGHLSAGHTVNNYSARVFGSDSGIALGSGGIHLFHLLYPDTFIQAEADRLNQSFSSIRDRMWKRYSGLMIASHNNRDFILTNEQGAKVPLQLGALTFSRLPRARDVFQNDWKSRN